MSRRGAPSKQAPWCSSPLKNAPASPCGAQPLLSRRSQMCTSPPGESPKSHRRTLTEPPGISSQRPRPATRWLLSEACVWGVPGPSSGACGSREPSSLPHVLGAACGVTCFIPNKLFINWISVKGIPVHSCVIFKGILHYGQVECFSQRGVSCVPLPGSAGFGLGTPGQAEKGLVLMRMCRSHWGKSRQQHH